MHAKAISPILFLIILLLMTIAPSVRAESAVDLSPADMQILNQLSATMQQTQEYQAKHQSKILDPAFKPFPLGDKRRYERKVIKLEEPSLGMTFTYEIQNNNVRSIIVINRNAVALKSQSPVEGFKITYHKNDIVSISTRSNDKGLSYSKILNRPESMWYIIDGSLVRSIEWHNDEKVKITENPIEVKETVVFHISGLSEILSLDELQVPEDLSAKAYVESSLNKYRSVVEELKTLFAEHTLNLKKVSEGNYVCAIKAPGVQYIISASQPDEDHIVGIRKTKYSDTEETIRDGAASYMFRFDQAPLRLHSFRILDESIIIFADESRGQLIISMDDREQGLGRLRVRWGSDNGIHSAEWSKSK